MRIDDFISQLIAPVPAAPPRRQGGVAGVSGGSLGAGSQRRSPSSSIAIRSPEPVGSFQAPLRTRAKDSADLTTLGASRAGAAQGDLNPFPPPSAGDASADPASQGFSIVESFIRKRAVMSYRLPQAGPNGAQADFTVELEVAYRVIDVIPGGLLDTQA